LIFTRQYPCCERTGKRDARESSPPARLAGRHHRLPRRGLCADGRCRTAKNSVTLSSHKHAKRSRPIVANA